MRVKSAKPAAIRMLALSVVMSAFGIAASAKYIGAGEIRGTVTDVWSDRGVLVVRMDVEEQKVTGPQLGNPAQLFVRGDLTIERGMKLRVEFDGGNDIGCWPCGLNVTRIEFADSSVYDVPQPDYGVPDNFERHYPSWWEKHLRELAEMVALILVMVFIFFGIRGFARFCSRT